MPKNIQPNPVKLFVNKSWSSATPYQEWAYRYFVNTASAFNKTEIHFRTHKTEISEDDKKQKKQFIPIPFTFCNEPNMKFTLEFDNKEQTKKINFKRDDGSTSYISDDDEFMRGYQGFYNRITMQLDPIFIDEHRMTSHDNA